MNNGSEWDNPLQVVRRRRVNADGSNTIACKRCGREIAKAAREKLTTAICYSCATGKQQPKQVPILDGMPRPDLMEQSQEELLDAIYQEQASAEAGSIELKIKRKWSPLDLVAGAFKAMGFSQHQKAEPPKKVKYDTVDQETSKQIAKRKQRVPLFGNKDKE